MALSARAEFQCRPVSPLVRNIILLACLGGAVMVYLVLEPRMGLAVASGVATFEALVGVTVFGFLRATSLRQQNQRIAIDPDQALFTLRHFALYDGVRLLAANEQVTIGFDEVRGVERRPGGSLVRTARGDFFLSPNWVGYDELVGTFAAMAGD